MDALTEGNEIFAPKVAELRETGAMDFQKKY